MPYIHLTNQIALKLYFTRKIFDGEIISGDTICHQGRFQDFLAQTGNSVSLKGPVGWVKGIWDKKIILMPVHWWTSPSSAYEHASPEGRKKRKQWEINQFSTIIFYSRSLVASNHFQLIIQSIRLYAFHCHILKSTDVGESDWSNRQNISDCSIQPVSQVDFFIWVRFCLNTGKHLRQRILGWTK